MKIYLSLVFLLFSANGMTQNIDIDSLKTVIKQELKEELNLKNQQANSEAVTTTDKENKRLLKWSKLDFKGYAVVNYYNYGRYDTDLGIRDKIDAERLNLYLDYHLSDQLILHTEIEFEHGGTGSSLELDTQEEFGEFEQELESGGGVNLEQLNIEYRYKPYLNFRAGRMKLNFNLAQRLDDPDEYLTTTRPEMEDAILPLGWYENGIEIHGRFWKNKIGYELAFVNGLESSGFSSANWVKLGYQKKFEMVNAENFAVFSSLNYYFVSDKHTFAGVSYYYGNTADNRPKPDIKEPAHLKIFGAHISIFEYPFRFASQFIYGNLQNSELISQRNRNLPATLGIKKTPVAKNAMGFSAELGYDVLHLINKQSQMKLLPFLRYDFYDTMYKTAGNITPNKRWKRNTITGGINWFVVPQVAIKVQYATRKLGSDNVNIATGQINGKQIENTFSTGIGINF